MPIDIRKVAVIGSGVMGSQIAAQVVSAGVPVLLLDIVPKEAKDRNVLAKNAVDRLLNGGGAFMHPDDAKRIEIGNIDDDLPRLKECDCILEAVLENPKIKSDIYKKVDALRKPGTIIASNSATTPLDQLIADQSPAFAKDFMVTHFFNPVRHMRLLELIIGPKTDPRSITRMRGFCDKVLGKGVVPCYDAPGFVVTRLGMFWLQSAMNAAIELGLTVEEADEICCKYMGTPPTGVFGLIDLIGLDLMPLIGRSLASTLPVDDAYRRLYKEHEISQKMIANGLTGSKGKGGYYRFVETEGGRIRESINLATGEYGPASPPTISSTDRTGSDLRALCEMPDKIGLFAWRVLSQTLSYAFELIPATVPNVRLVDEGMKLGYNWMRGPFELLDRLGVDWMLAKLHAELRPVPTFLEKAAGKSFYRIHSGKIGFLQQNGEYTLINRPRGVLLLGDIKRAIKPIEENGSASLWDIGDGVLCLELTSKPCALDRNVFAMIMKASALLEKDDGAWQGLVIYNDGPNFCLGVDIVQLRDSLRAKDFGAVEGYIKEGQRAFRTLRFASFPSVATPIGATFGGGCELTLHCSANQAYCETSMGLADLAIGLTPALGGCTQLLARAYANAGEVPPVSQVFAALTSPIVSKSAADAKAMGCLRQTDGITMNRDRLLFDAKARVLELASAYNPPQPLTLNLPGGSGKAALDLIIESGRLPAHETCLFKILANILSGMETEISGPATEDQIMLAEYSAYMKLVRMPETLARIEHMIEKGLPLKN